MDGIHQCGVHGSLVQHWYRRQYVVHPWKRDGPWRRYLSVLTQLVDIVVNDRLLSQRMLFLLLFLLLLFDEWMMRVHVQLVMERLIMVHI